uniref:Uncharacterized protein n=1 Tax=Anguilla anguilla TaxID=7936 RepID=A0A0E9WL45_ANGAN
MGASTSIKTFSLSSPPLFLSGSLSSNEFSWQGDSYLPAILQSSPSGQFKRNEKISVFLKLLKSTSVRGDYLPPPRISN